MNITQFFHKKDLLPPFNIGDRVCLIKNPLSILPLYNKEYPSCFCTKSVWLDHWEVNLIGTLGNGVHIVSNIMKGTPAAGGWFISVDNKEIFYHGNIFELI
jgi:hypothetical protein